MEEHLSTWVEMERKGKTRARWIWPVGEYYISQKGLIAQQLRPVSKKKQTKSKNSQETSNEVLYRRVKLSMHADLKRGGDETSRM